MGNHPTSIVIRVAAAAVHALTGPGACCRFTPSCSQYARQAVEQEGFFRGSWKALVRLSRCRPGGGFGFE